MTYTVSPDTLGNFNWSPPQFPFIAIYPFPAIQTPSEKLGKEFWDHLKISSNNIKCKRKLWIYIFIPYCMAKCRYCVYMTTRYVEEDARKYMDYLKRELLFYASSPYIQDNYEVAHIYISGGTPALCKREWIEDIIGFCRSHFPMAKANTIMLETHPTVLAGQKDLNALRNIGVTHLGVGIESFHDRLLQKLERNYSGDQAKQFVYEAQKAGMTLAGYFMYGIPFQRIGEWLEDLRIAAEELHLYQIVVLGFTGRWFIPWVEDSNKGIIRFPTHATKIALFTQSRQYLLDNGYEVRSACQYVRRKPEDAGPLWVWWDNESIGVGVSANTMLRDWTAQNTFSYKEYMEKMEKGESPINTGMKLSTEQQISLYTLCRLHCMNLNRKDFEERFNAPIESFFHYKQAIENLIDLDLLEDTGESLVPTSIGHYYMAHVGHEFLDPVTIQKVLELYEIKEEGSLNRGDKILKTYGGDIPEFQLKKYAKLYKKSSL